jgi:glucose-6-phosphate isomerase
MGGSILGAEAINNFLEKKIKKKIYFFEILNSKKMLILKKKNLNKILFLIISKSGNTIETVSNFFTLNIIKKNSNNIILLTEKKNNLLYSLSKKYNLFYIEHKNYIGGRYSVLSEVGIVPAYLMGININKLRSGSLKSLKKTQLFLKDSTIMLSSLLSFKKNK